MFTFAGSCLAWLVYSLVYLFVYVKRLGANGIDYGAIQIKVHA